MKKKNSRFIIFTCIFSYLSKAHTCHARLQQTEKITGYIRARQMCCHDWHLDEGLGNNLTSETGVELA